MINCANTAILFNQFQRVNELRNSLEKSLNEFSIVQQITPVCGSCTLPQTIKNNSAILFTGNYISDKIVEKPQSTSRPLFVIYQSTTATFIQITGLLRKKMETSRFTVSPTPNALPASVSPVSTDYQHHNCASIPLHVIVAGGEGSAASSVENLIGTLRSKYGKMPLNCGVSLLNETLSISTTLPPLLSNSPVSSIDSGVSSPAYDSLLFSSASLPAVSRPLATYSLPSSPSSVYQRHHHRSSCCMDSFMNYCGNNSMPGKHFFNYNISNVNCFSATTNCNNFVSRPRSASLSMDISGSIFNHTTSNEHPLKSGKSFNNKCNCCNVINNGALPTVSENFKENEKSSLTNNACLDNDADCNCLGGAFPFLHQNLDLENSDENTNFLSLLPKNQLSGSTNSVRSFNRSGLKSILKKPHNCFCYGRFNYCNQHNGMPTRFRLSRSCSETGSDEMNHTEFYLSNAFNKMTLSNNGLCYFANDDVLFEDDEFSKSSCEDTLSNCWQNNDTNNNNNTSDLSAGGDPGSDSNDEKPNDLTPRKKRVSFSEHVQARVYRSNSSIIGQKKKNERKNRVKRRRSESENADCINQFLVKPLCNVESKICHNCQKIQLEHKNAQNCDAETAACNLVFLRNSGLFNDLKLVDKGDQCNNSVGCKTVNQSVFDSMVGNNCSFLESVSTTSSNNTREKDASLANGVEQFISSKSALDKKNEVDLETERLIPSSIVVDCN